MTRTNPVLCAAIAVTVVFALGRGATAQDGKLPASTTPETDAAPAAVFPPLPAHEVRAHRHLIYGPTKPHHRLQTLDLYLPDLPEGSPKPPLVVFLHGGSWRAGSRGLYGPIGRPLAAPGYAVAIPGYRLTPEVRHPVHVQDCALAVSWLRKQADEFGYDGDRIVLAGHSAGAHLAALLATAPQYLRAQNVPQEAIKGVVGLSGPYDVRAPVGIFENAFGDDLDVRDEASPLRRDLSGAPPFMLLWAEDDLLGLAMVGQSMKRALARAEVPVQGRMIAARDHVSIASLMEDPGDPVAEAFVRFVGRVTAK